VLCRTLYHDENADLAPDATVRRPAESILAVRNGFPKMASADGEMKAASGTRPRGARSLSPIRQ
jgi:hypothetical protein